MANVKGASEVKEVPGVFGENVAGGEGVNGTSKAGTGVIGTSESGVGVWGGSNSSSGVGGMSNSGIGVHGVSKTAPGVRGDSESGDGVFGIGRRGVVGESPTYQGVFGKSRDNAGIVGESEKMHAIFGICHNPYGAGVFATNDAGGFGVQADCPNGIGVFGKGGKLAARFEGDVEVTGDIRLPNADCAEEFSVDTAVSVEPGTVMVLGEDGVLTPCQHSYDKRVAGVISGAGSYRPGIVLDKQNAQDNRHPIALLGKVYCKADARHAAIEVGDLLTTSDTCGHAMKATEPQKSFGAVIGKALRPLKEGQGLIPILIALQ